MNRAPRLGLVAALAAVFVGRFIPAPQQRAEVRCLRQGRLWLALAAAVLTMGGTLATYTYIPPLLTHRAGIPARTIPLAIVFGSAPAKPSPWSATSPTRTALETPIRPICTSEANNSH
ncbi:hypothetical protein [Streptomyces carpinensis]|uniref:Uncharacterized protein n=1 Tax=Streptomyces carpinensis TaxID=66369 RepID=A0ABV1W1Z1_9ACTN|nr:hypothetical protein [Streptomyces carpinensis]